MDSPHAPPTCVFAAVEKRGGREHWQCKWWRAPAVQDASHVACRGHGRPSATRAFVHQAVRL
eukprot:5519006-Lingulodinium_polyedra.AAC.1